MKMMKSEEMLGQGSVWKAIARMSIPAVLTMVVMVVYNMADMYFVGKTGEELQIAAISLSSPVYMLQMAVGTLIGGGGCAAISNALGMKDLDLAKAESSSCLVLTVAAGTLIGGAVLLFPDAFLRLLGADADTWRYTRDYMMVLGGGTVSILFSNAFSNLIRAEGASKESMIGNGIGTILNILLDPLFILALKMGVMGAAVATVIGNSAACVYYVWYILRKDSELTLHPANAFRKPVALGKVVVLGIPNAVSSLLGGMTGTISNRILISYGAGAIVAMGVGGKASMIVSMVVMGLCLGVQPVIAYNYGAGNKKRTREVLIKTGVMALVVGMVLTIGCLVFRRTIAGMFVSEEVLLEQSIHIMEIHLIMTAFLGLYYIGINFQQSAGNALLATFLSVFRQGILYVPLLFLMHHLLGLEGVYWVNVICDGLSIVLAMALLVWQMRK